MPRFFIPPDQIQNNRFTLTGSESRHASKVLRMKAGDLIDLFDGKDLSYQGKIETISSDRLEGVILSQQKGAHSSPVDLILYQALIKGAKWDWLVEKACEIGVAQLVPILTVRTIVKPSSENANERWKRIALAASKQCGRSDVMAVMPPIPANEALSEAVPDCLSLIPWEKESQRSVRQACHGFKGKRVRVFIGPEGGWDSKEVERAERYGVIPVRLGPTLLRSETAGLVAATLVLAELDVYS
jgi:16S rRNA (uracil1498-N3)-methyltransferase